MTSEAIVIGVNQYEFLQPLQYARQDALALKTFLEMEAKFDRVYYFADDAPGVNGMSMRPTRQNLRRVMRDTFAKPFMGDGDNFWFFFSGHGMRDGERDFLMPIDGDPDDVEESGISMAQVSEWLRGCGADNVVMILDACRSGGRKDGKGIGDETKEDCRQTGVISLFSCSPNQFSYELPQYQQGAFTKVLLEGLGVQGACATVARLDEYLKRRVPEVVRECLGNTVNQFPYSIAEPINKSHLILMPQHSRPEDLNVLKMDALWAEKRGDLRLALQCWLRVNVASGGLDADFHDAVFDLKLKLRESTIQPPKSKSQTTSEVLLFNGHLGGSGTVTEPIDRRIFDLEERLDRMYKLLELKERAMDSAECVDKTRIRQMIEHLKRELLEVEQEYSKRIALEVRRRDIPEAIASHIADELLDEIQMMNPETDEMRSMLQHVLAELEKPNVPSATKLKVTIPLIPNILTYEIEMDTESLTRRLFPTFLKITSQFQFRKVIPEIPGD
jgi:uncharacterized caspase-like protein